MLLSAGFDSVTIDLKDQSREVIKEWIPGSGAEDYIVSANITAWKGESSGDVAVKRTVQAPAPPPAAGG